MFVVVGGWRGRVLGAVLIAPLLSGSAAALAAGAAADSMTDADTGLHLSLVPSQRYFMRIGTAYIKPYDSSTGAKDIAGPVVPRNVGDIVNQEYANPAIKSLVGLTSNAKFEADLLQTFMSTDVGHGFGEYTNGIGIPADVRQKSSSGRPTFYLSLGMYLDDDKQYSAETFVLGAPIKLNAVGQGLFGPGPDRYYDLKDGSGTPDGPYPKNVLGKVGSTKLLPLTMIFTRYFGQADARFRPSAGVMLTYNLFFETEASQSLADYSGGPTKIKLKDAPGIGPMLGIDYQVSGHWNINARLGYVMSKTQGTVTTQANPNTMAQSPVVYDLVGLTGAAARFAYGSQPLVQMYRALAYAKTGDPNNLGTYVRTFDYKTNAGIVMLSASYSF